MILHLRIHLLVLLLLAAGTSFGGAPAYKLPLKVSADGRHLADNDGTPFLMVADAAWQLLRKLSYEDAVHYLDVRKSQSFNTVLVQLLPSLPSQRNFNKIAPFLNEQDLNNPDKRYFEYLEKIVVAAKQRGMVVGIVVSRKSWNLLFETGGEETCRSFGAFIGEKFSGHNNVFWVVSEEENQKEFLYKNITEGLRSATKNQLIASLSTCSPGTYTDSLNRNRPDLKLIIPDSTVTVSEYATLSAWQKSIGQSYPYPFIIANSEFPREITDQSALIRNQAYQSMLSSASGFCHVSTIKNFNPTWKVNMTKDGAEYMVHFLKIMNAIPWSVMGPDTTLNLTPDSLDRAEISSITLSNGRMAMLYLPHSRQIWMDLTPLHGTVLRAVWYSPRTGKRWPGGDFKPEAGLLLQPPDKQSDWDWILLIGSRE